MRAPPGLLGCPITFSFVHQALSAFLEVEEELCAEEARSVVAETMAPFEDQLVEMQREKDFAAIQVRRIKGAVLIFASAPRNKVTFIPGCSRTRSVRSVCTSTYTYGYPEKMSALRQDVRCHYPARRVGIFIDRQQHIHTRCTQ